MSRSNPSRGVEVAQAANRESECEAQTSSAEPRLQAAVVGLDIGATKILSGVADRKGQVVTKSLDATDATTQEALVSEIDAIIASVRGDLAAIGIGVPGLVMPDGTITVINIPLEGVHLGRHLRDKFGVPAAVENDADMAALAEHRFGAAKGANTAIVLTLGTGVGSGLILNGHLFRGGLGSVSELGHMTIDYDGPLCYGACHGRGHVESYVSGTAIAEAAVAQAQLNPDGDLGRAGAAGSILDAETTVHLAKRADGDARVLIRHVGQLLGVALSSYINIFGPEVIVLGGGVSAAADLLIEPARQAVLEHAQEPGASRTRIVRAAFGNEAGMIGAVARGLELAEEATH
jgi:glucokinase